MKERIPLFHHVSAIAATAVLLLTTSTPAAARQAHVRSAPAIHAAEVHGGGAWGPRSAAHARRAAVQNWHVDALHLNNGRLLGRLTASGSPGCPEGNLEGRIAGRRMSGPIRDDSGLLLLSFKGTVGAGGMSGS